MKKITIPAAPPLDNIGLRNTVENMRYNMEIITGRRGTPVATLATTATNAQLIAKINELILLLQE